MKDDLHNIYYVPLIDIQITVYKFKFYKNKKC